MKITSITRLKHAELLQACRDFGTARRLANHLGIPATTLGRWVTLKDFPKFRITKRSTAEFWERLEIDLMQITERTVEQLWPDELKTAIKGDTPTTIEQNHDLDVAHLAYAQHTTKRLADCSSVDPEQTPPETIHEKVNFALRFLTHREREVIKLRFGLSDGFRYTYEEAGRIFKVTRERIRQIESKALKHLGRSTELRELAVYLNINLEPEIEDARTSAWSMRSSDHDRAY